MATITSVGSGNWSAGATWDSNPAIPGIGDAVVIANTHAVALDVDTAALLSLTGQGSGSLTIDMTAGNRAITATTITAGTGGATGFIVPSGAAANTLTITTGTGAGAGIIGGGAANSHCIVKNNIYLITIIGNVSGSTGFSGKGILVTTGSTTGLVNITGNLTGGNVTNADGVRVDATSPITVTGNISTVAAIGLYQNSTGTTTVINSIITGGTAAYGYGMNCGAVAPIFTNVKLVNGTKAVAYSGYPPAWTPAITDYQTWGAIEWVSVTALTAANIKKSIVSGNTTGTYAFNVNGIDVTGPA